jgi:TM2 domain-containing membrane protein YozV
MKYCSNCGKAIPAESSKFCDNCGAKIANPNLDEQIDQQESISNAKEEKNPYLALLCSFFIPGLGQVYNGSTAKGIGFFFGTVIGAFFLIIPGLIIWIIGMFDAYSEAKKMNTGEIPFVPTKTAHLILFLILVGFITALVAFIIFVFFLAMIAATLSTIMHAGSPTVYSNSPSTAHPVYAIPTATYVPVIRTPYPTPVPTIQRRITDGYWCRATTVNIGKDPTDVKECYQFLSDGTFKWGYSPGWPMGKSASCFGENMKCAYSLNPAGKYEVQGGYIFTLSGDSLIDAHNPPYYRWTTTGIP